MARKRQLADAFEDLEEDLPDTPPVLDPRAMHDQIEADHREKENRKAASSPQPLMEGSAIAESVPPENTTEKLVHEPTEMPLSAAEMALALALENANILQSPKKFKLIMDAIKQLSLGDIRSLPDYDTLMSAASAAGHAPT
ncbi:hypothetical protein E4U13_001563 [Claviceps humidiphila]|uniref:Uncharacterized protein n=1 Tax=Claviceps humidiphila TaxID=1294629 RepID=A0A9P7TTQ1_9HYPO|nr:hypothetical protein E4U13_001563 [Claviceps humidiphila]